MWLVGAFGRFLRGDQAQAHLLAGDGVIASDLRGLAIADQIAARIAHMRDGYAVIPQSAGHDGGGHAGRGAAAGVRPLQKRVIGLLHQPWQHCGVRLPRPGPCENRRPCSRPRCGRDFALFVAAHAIRQHKQPAVRAHLRGSRGRGVAEVVFVVIADPSDDRCVPRTRGQAYGSGGGAACDRARPAGCRSSARCLLIRQGLHSIQTQKFGQAACACPSFLAN